VIGPEPHGGIIDSWYFNDPSGHRLEIVVPTAGKDKWDSLETQAYGNLDKWEAHKAAHSIA
jgi:hypothetical protein